MSKKNEKDEKDKKLAQSETEFIIDKMLTGVTNLKDKLEDRAIPRCPDFKSVEYKAVGPADPLESFLSRISTFHGDVDAKLSEYDRDYGRRMPMINETVYVRLPWQFEYEDIKEYRVGFTGIDSFILENFRELDEEIAVLSMSSYGELWAYRAYDLKVYIDKVKGDEF